MKNFSESEVILIDIVHLITQSSSPVDGEDPKVNWNKLVDLTERGRNLNVKEERDTNPPPLSA